MKPLLFALIAVFGVSPSAQAEIKMKMPVDKASLIKVKPGEVDGSNGVIVDTGELYPEDAKVALSFATFYWKLDLKPGKYSFTLVALPTPNNTCIGQLPLHSFAVPA